MIQLYQTLDLRPIGIPRVLRLSQYDSDFEIIFELTNFDGTWILDTDTTAEVQGTKTDGHGYSADAVFDDQLKTVTIAGDVQMTAAAGRNVFEVVLFHDGDRLGSKNFILDVERAALDAETTASDSKIKNFTEMVEAAEDAAETATAAAEAAEEAAASIIPGLSDDAKEALLACFRNVAWINDQGQTYYDALYDALYSSKTLLTIEAVFNQGSAVIYADDTLDDLKQYLTVTAYYNDQTSAVVTNYSLLGTLDVGTSTITVFYGNVSDTFEVTVTPALPSGYTRLKSVITTGLEYIDIGLNETEVEEAEYEMMVTGIAAGTDTYAYGQHFLSSLNTFFPYMKTNNDVRQINANRRTLQSVTSGSKDIAWLENVRYKISAYRNGSNAVLVNDEEKYTLPTGSTESADNNFYLFTYGGNPPLGRYRFCGHLYSLSLYDSNSNLICEMIPAKNSNNVVGLYDRIRSTFYTSDTQYPLSGEELS